MDTVFLIKLSTVEAEQIIATAARHLPIGADLGLIRAVTSAGVLADDAYGNPVMFGCDDDAAGTWRVAAFADGLSEHTAWFQGVEIGRRITRAGADD